MIYTSLEGIEAFMAFFPKSVDFGKKPVNISPDLHYMFLVEEAKGNYG
jgi:hypothetical protein